MAIDYDGENGRGPDGRFGKGNRGGPGNPAFRRMAEFRKAILDAATTDQAIALIGAMHKAALAGDVAAAKLWLSYTAGAPPQPIELSGPDGEPLGIAVEQIRAVLIQAVGDDPEARARVAVALRSLARTAPDVPNDGESDE